MDLQLAGIIAHDTRDQAVQDARIDLHRLQQQAIEAGGDESRRLIKVSHIDRTSGQATYRPAGRLLRDWYLHCYTNSLRDRLGSPAVTVDAQQIEDTAALLRRLTPHQTGIAALRAVAVLRDVADADAARAAVTIATTLHATAARRAIAHAPDTRFDTDPLRIHVSRHWYLHCYLDHLHAAIRSGQPHPVTDAVERQVARTLTTRTTYPLVSDAAMTLNMLDPGRLDRIIGETDPNVASQLGAPITDRSPEEAARNMFHHDTQLQDPNGHVAQVTSGSRLPGLSDTVRDPHPRGHSLPPRIA